MPLEVLNSGIGSAITRAFVARLVRAAVAATMLTEQFAQKAPLVFRAIPGGR
jgi:hypothetical protein